MNVELLLRVKAKILEEPRQFNMRNYFFTDASNVPNCHTAACIGGWGIALSRNETPNQAEFSTRPHWARQLAIKAFDLTDKEADKLFHANNEGWGPLFADRYNNADNPTLAAQVAAERIDHFIATGGLE